MKGWQEKRGPDDPRHGLYPFWPMPLAGADPLGKVVIHVLALGTEYEKTAGAVLIDMLDDSRGFFGRIFPVSATRMSINYDSPY